MLIASYKLDQRRLNHIKYTHELYDFSTYSVYSLVAHVYTPHCSNNNKKKKRKRKNEYFAKFRRRRLHFWHLINRHVLIKVFCTENGVCLLGPAGILYIKTLFFGDRTPKLQKGWGGVHCRVEIKYNCGVEWGC